VTIPVITIVFRALPSAKMSIVLRYDFDIFWPSVPGTTVTLSWCACGVGKTFTP
jgi:hypothetical protein